MTTGIVIVVHAPLGAAMRECASHVMGNLDGMLAIHDIQPEDPPDALAPDVLKDILEQEHGAGVLVLTDLIGATPANIAKRAVADAQADADSVAHAVGRDDVGDPVAVVVADVQRAWVAGHRVRDSAVEGPVAMGYVPASHAAPGTAIFAEVRGKYLPLTVAALPFIKPTYKR